MKYVFLSLIASIAIGASAHAQDVYHQGYMTSRGTEVQGHYQTAPNDTRMDNYSTRGNVNPYTQQPGYESPEGR